MDALDLPELTLVRSELESFCTPRHATRILREALRRHNAIPDNPTSLRTFCFASVAPVVAEQHSPAAAEEFVERLLSILQRVSSAPPPAFETEQTRQGPKDAGELNIAVLAKQNTLVSVLETRLAGNYNVDHCSSLIDLRLLQGLRPTNFILVDAVRPCPINASEIADCLRSQPARPIIYGDESPLGRALRGYLRSEAIYLPEREGIAPLCDLLLARLLPPHQQPA